MEKQLTLELNPANEDLVGIVFRERKNRVPLPCSLCPDNGENCRGKSRCSTYTRWLASDGKIITNTDRCGREKLYIPLER